LLFNTLLQHEGHLLVDLLGPALVFQERHHFLLALHGVVVHTAKVLLVILFLSYWEPILFSSLYILRAYSAFALRLENIRYEA
jgi:hypothetical protein